MLARALPLVVALLPLCAAEDDPVRRTIVDVNGQQAIVDSSAHYELFDHEDKPLFGHAGHDAGKARCRKPLASRSWSMCGTLLCQWTSRAASALSSDGSFLFRSASADGRLADHEQLQVLARFAHASKCLRLGCRHVRATI